MSETLAAPVTEKIDPAPATPVATTPAPATPAQAAPATLATGTGTPPTPVQTDWPSDWRQKLALENPDDIKTLERFTDPNTLWKQNKELRAKLSSGEVKTKLPDNPTPEQLAEFRKSIGVPERPEDYKLELPNGVVFSEADKPLVETFKKVAHGLNVEPKVVNGFLGWYTDQQQIVQAQRADLDQSLRDKSEEALRRKWGNEYKTADGTPGKNLNAISAVFSEAPKDLFEAIATARDKSGNFLGDRMDVLEHLAKLGRELYPTSTLLPMSADMARGAQERKAEIQKLMADKNSDYHKGPKSAALQTEYLEILQSLERAGARRAAA